MKKGSEKLIVIVIVVLLLFGFAVSASAGVGQWTSNGPNGGNISAIAVSPNFINDQTMFAGTKDGCVFKSSDGGSNWTAVYNDTFGRIYSINDIALSSDYANDQTLFFRKYGGDIYKSNNGGASWTQVYTGVLPDYITDNISKNKLAISPNYANDQTIFALTYYSGHVYRSTDGGANWSEINNGLTYYDGSSLNVDALAMSTNFINDHTVFAFTSNGVFKSTDGGGNWSEVGSMYDTVKAVAVSPNFAHDKTILIVGYYPGEFGNTLLKSTDGGVHWAAIDNNIPWYITVYALAISPNYANDHTIFAGAGQYLYKSVDAGASWTENSGITTFGIDAIVLSPNYANDHSVFAGTQGGLYKSTNCGSSWTGVNTGLTGTEVNALSASPNYANDHTVFAAADCSGVFKSTDGGASWSAVNNGLAYTKVFSVAVSPDYINDNTVFAGTNRHIYKTTDGGASWTEVFISSSQVQSLAISPNYASDNLIYAGTSGNGIYESRDGGASWAAVNNGFSQYIEALAISPDFANDQTIFAGLSSVGVFKSIDGGLNWMAIKSPKTNKFSAYVNAFAISPNYVNDKDVIVSQFFYDGNERYAVFKSRNGGINWFPIHRGTCVNSLAVSPNYFLDNTLFAGTYNGKILKRMHRAWKDVGVGIPAANISALALSPNFAVDQTVLAGTQGAGVWNYSSDITLSLSYNQSGASVTLTATMNSGGNPAEGKRLTFYELKGDDKIKKGSKITDSSGVAVLTCKSEIGPHSIIAEYEAPDIIEDSNSVAYMIDKVSLTSPASNTEVNTKTPTLSWQPYDGATGYHLQVATASDFRQSSRLLDTDTSDTSIMTPALKPGKKYFWRVRAYIQTGTSMYSDSWHFTY